MSKVYLLVAPISSLLASLITLALSIRRTSKLVNEKEALILKNDSLHIKEIKTKKELSLLQTKLDSPAKNKEKLSD